MQTKTLLTCEEFEQMDNELCELIDGEVVQLAPGGNEHSSVSVNFTVILANFVKTRKLGRVLGNEAGIHIQKSPARSRGMDVAYISYQRLPAGKLPKGFLRVPPELIVEVLGDEVRAARIADKIEDYHRMGVNMVWVADPESRTVTQYPLGGKPVQVAESAMLQGGEILPGFSIRVAEFFDEG